MKWTEDKVNILQNKVLKGVLYKDIAEELGCTEKAVMLKAQRLSLKSIQNKIKKEKSLEIKICKICEIEFECRIKDCRVVCSTSCGSKYAHITLNKELKNNKITLTHYIKNKSVCKNRNFRICKKCKEDFYCKTAKQYCDKCRTSYYSIYRPSCEFDFMLDDYKDKIPNYNLIKEYGLYSPSNKGNNLNGISKDHMVSVKYGFENNISPEIIKHPANCMLLKHSDNNIKKTSNSITIEELIKRIEEF